MSSDWTAGFWHSEGFVPVGLKELNCFNRRCLQENPPEPESRKLSKQSHRDGTVLDPVLVRLMRPAAMTASIRATTGSLSLLHFLLGVFLSRPEGGVALELLPSSPEVLLQSQSNFSVVCSGWSEVKWRLPQDADGGPEVLVRVDGSSRILQLLGATWRSSGRYTCEEPSADQSRTVDVFIPGQGPEQWFVPQSSSQVYKHSEEGTIPCVVSNPKLNVSLFERPGRTAVGGVRYEPALGFMGRLNDAGHICVATDGDQERESQVFYVFTVLEPKQMEMELSVSSQVLKQGEVLTMNCSVKDVDMAFFTWTFPRRQEVEPLTDILSNEIRSFINISKATESDSGVYVCKAQDSQFRWTVRKNITITVLDHGYVYLWPSGETNISSLVHHTVELKVEGDAHPTPTFTWARPNQTIAIETSSVNTTHLTSSRYVSTLTLHQVQLDQAGTYTATASNEDSREDVMFYLQVTAPPRILSLSEVDKKDILCVSEGVPTPSVAWYTCPRLIRCSNLSDGWRSQLGALEQDVTTVIEGGGTLVKSVLTLKTLDSVSAVRCEATNAAGGRARDLRVLRTSLLSQVVVLVAVLVLVIIGPIYLITEFCRHGNLLSYLKRNKDTFGEVDMPSRSNSDGGYMDMNQDGRGRYVPLKELKDTEQGTGHAPTDHQTAPLLLLSDSPFLTMEDLLSFSFQVAQAMDFLSSRKRCWDEDPLSRPSFSSLVVAVGNMLPADYRQRYAQLTEDFLRGDGPAILQSRRSLSRTTKTETETDVQLDRNSSHCAARLQEAELGFHFTGSPSSDVKERLLEAEPEDSGPSHNAYIMPVVTMETSSSTALDAVSPLLSGPADIFETQEVTSPPEAPAEAEEESCLHTRHVALLRLPAPDPVLTQDRAGRDPPSSSVLNPIPVSSGVIGDENNKHCHNFNA
ncbi:hypothetical protein CCH79_00016150 [Gambusia affinis]|uniref:Platelet-derived growth factor receptor-like protein n=1 Tax=Gambusia affinis TaxID=33528 RepID=A0A315VNL8_GAMAF|nr:hypothetical protein CCH79_00016150 [Gambusia affinis]